MKVHGFVAGQLVALEVIDTDDTTCPIELIKIPVPACDPEFDQACTGTKHLPYERIAYDKNTGQSPNMPRKQVKRILMIFYNYIEHICNTFSLCKVCLYPFIYIYLLFIVISLIMSHVDLLQTTYVLCVVEK